MITLITGTPGAGKTLYAISKLLRDLVGSVIKSVDEQGHEVEIPRRILTNIPRLLLEHELIGPDIGGGLADWQEWCKPGDVIVYDEVQRSWPPRPNGSKVPDYISALETHRHKGVDFIIITQHPMLIDRNVLALVGRHLHVRRFGGIGAALVYEWDHCSRSLMYSKSLKKSPFRYDKSVFKQYMSAELHTKPKTSIPPLAIVVICALVASAVLLPIAYKRIASKAEPAPTSDTPDTQTKPPVGSVAPSAPSGSNPSSVPGTGLRPMTSNAPGQRGQPYDSTMFIPVVSYEPRSAPAYDHLREVVAMPRIVGRVCDGDAPCYCITQQRTAVPDDQCDEWNDWRKRRFDPFKPDQQTLAIAADQTSSVVSAVASSQ
ncbi:MAG: zonular occludens toxin domain-containing protein [Acidovorax sp.]|uniref:zonular occludens toxin domain-containing protein n=1 Tax=Acidovorax sp. TaxID=1872122 RepID=UPI002613AB88|nr:zonular occludens toxin domain-containing protein [Acidovorax sp.]MDH4419198.1 zonular occludens toxin domain-containing protein [Acidovorax sp.]